MPMSHDENENPMSSDPAYEAAFEAMRPRLKAMPDEAVKWDIRLDASTAADVVEAVVARLAPFIPALEARFGAEATTLSEDLLLVARATRHANTQLALAQPMSDASPLFKAAMDSYRRLMADAESLAYRGLLDPQKLDRARDIKGYQPFVQSLLVLVSVWREAWPRVEGHTPVTLADIENGARAARTMTTQLARRDFGTSRTPEADDRNRALTMLVERYDDARMMMSCLRWKQDDLDQIVPSLFATRRRRARTDFPTAPPQPRVVNPTPEPEPAADPTPGSGPMDPTAPGGPFAQ